MHAQTSSSPAAKSERSPDTLRSTAPPPPKLSRTSLWVTLLVTLAAVGLLATGIGKRLATETERGQARAVAAAEQQAAAQVPLEVTVVSPVPFDFEPHYSITGTLDPLQKADLAFNVPGRLRSVDVALGDEVRAGQKLATLDRRSITAASQLAAASVQASEAQQRLAADALRRAEALHARGAVSEASLLAAQQQLAIAEAQVAQASAQNRMTSTDGSNHILRAPFAGTVTRVPGGVGNVVSPGEPLFRVEDLSSLVLRSGITERAIPRIRVGDPVELEGLEVRGEVRAKAPSLDPITRRAPIEISIPNEDHGLVGHSLVRGSILTGRSMPALRVPPTAIRGDQTVLVVDEDALIQVRPVHSRVANDGTGIVLGGLEASDRVVVRPSPDLTPGRAVTPVAADAAEQEAP